MIKTDKPLREIINDQIMSKSEPNQNRQATSKDMQASGGLSKDFNTT